jgi:hypothetical protein
MGSKNLSWKCAVVRSLRDGEVAYSNSGRSAALAFERPRGEAGACMTWEQLVFNSFNTLIHHNHQRPTIDRGQLFPIRHFSSRETFREGPDSRERRCANAAAYHSTRNQAVNHRNSISDSPQPTLVSSNINTSVKMVSMNVSSPNRNASARTEY